MTLSLCALLALISAGVWTAMSHRVAAALALVAVSVLWPFVNSSIEGPVLWVVGRGHGLTASDLLSPVGVAVAAVRLWLRPRDIDPGTRRLGGDSGTAAPNPDL